MKQEEKQRICAERDRKLLELRDNNECLTGAEIGREFGITRERTRQILKREDRSTKKTGWGGQQFCPSCGKFRRSRKKGGKCKKCYSDSCLIPVSCSECNKIFKMSANRVIWQITFHNQQMFFCSNDCKGKHLGKTYGVLNKGKRRSLPSCRKYDYDKVIEQLKIKTVSELTKEMNSPYISIKQIEKWAKKRGLLS